MTWTHVAAISGPKRDSVIVVDGSLPRIEGDSYRLPDVLDAFEPLLGRPVFLRVGAHVELGDDDYLRLYEFDASERGDRIPLRDAEAAQLAPPEVHGAVDRWLAEQRSGQVPSLRPPWARPGWHARAERWLGRPLRPYRLWPLSAVLESDGEFFKAVFPLFHHEPAVTSALARENPGLVPEVLRTDDTEGWLVTRALPHERASDEQVFESLAEIQHAWRSRHDELYAVGAENRTLDLLEQRFADEPRLTRVIRELRRRGEPETIVHGDFNRGNVVLAGGRAVIFDWSDACIGHPAFDRCVYSEETDDPVEAIPAFLNQSISYRAIAANLEPSDRWWFDGAEPEWLARARGLLAS